MKANKYQLLTMSLVSLTTCSGLLLVSIHTYADNDSAVDEVAITVPTSCTMTGTVNTAHTATLNPGTWSGASGTTYENGIGKTTLTTFCNDNNGFSVYAIGYTNDTDGDNTLQGTSASSNATINTKVYESSDTTSNWSMKVTKVDNPVSGDLITYNPNNMTISNSFNNWHTVPDDYTKVAEYHASTGSSTTDTTLGAKLETTYATYISSTQPADTYTGQVKYVMVHPYNATAPAVATPGVYTLSRADGGESATQIGQPIPNDTATYDTPEEAMAAWEETWSEYYRYPFYLKHIVVDNVITESYIGLTVTPEMATYGEMILGDYAFRGGVDESSLQDKPIFATNVSLMKAAYNDANYPDRCDGDDDYFYCSSGYVDLQVSSSGSVQSSDAMHCNIDDSGYSSCEWQ